MNVEPIGSFQENNFNSEGEYKSYIKGFLHGREYEMYKQEDSMQKMKETIEKMEIKLAEMILKIEKEMYDDIK